MEEDPPPADQLRPEVAGGHVLGQTRAHLQRTWRDPAGLGASKLCKLSQALTHLLSLVEGQTWDIRHPHT